MPRDKSAKMATWQKNSHFAILALLLLCINFKNSFGQMTSSWVLWKTCYTLFLKMCLRPCPGPSMYLFERINWIISSFPHRISKILFVLGCWGVFVSLESRIGEGLFFYDSILSFGNVIWRAKVKICSTFAFEFFLKFWSFVGFILSSFLFSFQKYKFFWNRTKIDVFTMFFPWNYFLCGRIPSFLENGKQNVKVLWEDFRCHLILWVTMWAEFFSHCDSHCEKIVRKMWVEMNTLIVLSGELC